ncbi:hypothetical protein L5515_000962 [Caenorhabditis briggsae]|uniref:Arginyl-tRNA--protein transferase 1 n=1 Tax=Caenorhabditis briggsae TaxID=6238 RepID=A0AAE9E1F7_CAEBR|nr:hypothetical protein L5515_000962 [Caenorhabditis briggsae]
MVTSFLEYLTTNDRNSCGYCKNEQGERTPDSSVTSALSIVQISHDDMMRFEAAGWSTSLQNSYTLTGGAWAHNMNAKDYGRLLDMGWRRSGRYLYKPNNRLTCCPQFTIRLDVTKFKMSRSQKRAMRQMNEFLATGKRPVCGIKEEDSVEKNQKKSSLTSAETTSTSHQEPPSKKMKDSDRPVLTKKEILNKRFLEKCQQRNLDPEEVRAERKAKDAARQRTIQSYIDEARPDWKHKLEIKIIPVDSREFDERSNESFDLYKRYQTTIHKDHHCRFAGFRKFLCDSPLSIEKRDGVELGSFHMWFLLDEKIIAVSVLDVLPQCVSAKYMFYDPDYSFLSLGTYTALREIDVTKRFQQICPSLRYYYMGYYIHSCPKMRYKAKFRPSDLLCEKSKTWLTFDACKELLDKSTNSNGFTEFRPEEPQQIPLAVDDILVYSKREILTFAQALIRFPEIADNNEFLQKVRELTILILNSEKTLQEPIKRRHAKNRQTAHQWTQ